MRRAIGWWDTSNLFTGSPDDLVASDAFHRAWRPGFQPLADGDVETAQMTTLSRLISSKPAAADASSNEHRSAITPFVGDAIGDTTATAAALAVNSAFSSVIDHVGDLDVFRVSLVAGQSYVLDLERLNQTNTDMYLELLNSSGVQVAVDDDSGIGNNAHLVYTATQSGTFYIVARTFANNYTGQYVLNFHSLTVGSTSPTTFPDNGEGLPQFSWDQAALQITRQTASWTHRYEAPVVVTYAFRSNAPGTMPGDTGEFSRFNAAQISAAEAALRAWAAVANITFQRVDSGDGYSDDAAILFGNYATGREGAAAFAYYPFGNTAASAADGDVWVNVSLSYNANPVVGEYGQMVLLHEIGHAIGLSHPGDYNAGPGVSITYETHAEYFNDTRMFSVMSYFGSNYTGGNLPAYASLPQLHDIAAIQRLYGANLSTRAGDTIYGYNSNTGVAEYSLTQTNQNAVFTIWDGGGVDTLDLSNYSSNNVIDLREEAFSNVGPGWMYNISIARGSIIENATGGSGNDTITGNDAVNRLIGGAGSDSLRGGLGNDVLQGGEGNDTFVYAPGDGADAVDGGNGTDTLSIIGGAGADVLSVSWNGAALNVGGSTLTSVEAITADLQGSSGDRLSYVSTTAAVTVNLGSGAASGFTSILNIEHVTGGSGADSITGNAIANQLNGGAGNDTLDGAGGNDTLIGGSGADALNGGDGFDTADYASSSAAVTVRLWNGTGANGDAQGDTFTSIEKVIGSAFADSLAGANGVNQTLLGGNGDDSLYGGNASDTLEGGNGDDRLEGKAGADVLSGGAGFDTADYSKSTVGVIIRLWNGTGEKGDAQGDTLSGIEKVLGSAKADSIAGANGVNQWLVGGDGDDALYGGNAIDKLEGGAGDDKLEGKAGADELIGGDGFDTADYSKSTVGVVIRLWNGTGEKGDAQGDTLSSIEKVVGSAKADSLQAANGVNTSLFGGDGNDSLFGGNANDTLEGGNGDDKLEGKAGADVLNGGAGFDTADYSKSSVGVVIRLWNGTGDKGDATGDTLISIEKVIGSAKADSLAAANGVNTWLIGGDGNDGVYGANGADTLDGGAGNDTIKGGLGNDTLTGGAGADNFVFDTALGPSNIDVITDFSVADDTIQLDNTFFGLGLGVLAAGAFRIGAAAGDADDRIIYDSATGALYFDADGNGAGAAVQFATLAAGLALTNADFFGVP